MCIFPWVPYSHIADLLYQEGDGKRWIKFLNFLEKCACRLVKHYKINMHLSMIYSSFMGICYGISPPATNLVNDLNTIPTKTFFLPDEVFMKEYLETKQITKYSFA